MDYITEIFNQSNKSKYAYWYIELCKRAQCRVTDDSAYYEKHHIVPKNLKGSNSRKNLVRLTGREHFIAHLLLTKMFDSTNLIIKMKAGLGAFVGQNRNGARKLNSRQISLARCAKSESQKGKKFTEEHKFKIRQSLLGLKRTPEQNKRNSDSHKGNQLSRESLDKGVRVKRENQERIKNENPELYARQRFLRISSTSKGHVFIDDVEYPSMGEAARTIGRNPDYVEARVLSDKYPTWIFLPRGASLKNV
jgi:hypothetical protein